MEDTTLDKLVRRMRAAFKSHKTEMLVSFGLGIAVGFFATAVI